jgi:hypothetical protein
MIRLFVSWGEVQDYATYDPAGGDLQPFVDLVDTHGPDAILAAVDELTDEDHADATVSTAHKAKGVNGQPSGSATASHLPRTPANTTPRAVPSRNP